MAAPTLDFFVQLESRVWEALVAGNPVADAAMLSADFLGVYTDGFSGRSEHAAMLDDGPTAADYAINDARLRMIGDDNALLSYRADWRRLVNGAVGEPESMYITSLWTRRGGRWINTFSQDTPAAPPG